MIPLFSSLTKPIYSSESSIACFNIDEAYNCFKYGHYDYVIALDEKTSEFKRCSSLKECDDFWKDSLNKSRIKKINELKL